MVLMGKSLAGFKALGFRPTVTNTTVAGTGVFFFICCSLFLFQTYAFGPHFSLQACGVSERPYKQVLKSVYIHAFTGSL